MEPLDKLVDTETTLRSSQMFRLSGLPTSRDRRVIRIASQCLQNVQGIAVSNLETLDTEVLLGMMNRAETVVDLKRQISLPHRAISLWMRLRET